MLPRVRKGNGHHGKTSTDEGEITATAALTDRRWPRRFNTLAATLTAHNVERSWCLWEGKRGKVFKYGN